MGDLLGIKGFEAGILGVRWKKRTLSLAPLSLVGTLKVIPVCGGLLQRCVRDVRLFTALCSFEKV